MALSARRRTAIKRGALAIAIAIVLVALIAAPQLFHTSTRPSAPSAPVATIAEVTDTSPAPSANVAKTRPRPSSLSTAIVARGEHSLDELATVRRSDVDPSEISDLDSWLVQIPGTSVQDLFSGADDLFAGDQPLDVPETQLAGYYPRGPWAGGFGVGPRRDSDASGSAGGGNAGDGGGSGLNTQGNSSQFNPSSPGGNKGDGGNGNNNGGNGNNNTDQPTDTNVPGNEHSQGESHSTSGSNPSDGPGPGPAGLSANISSEEPISVPEPSTLLLAGFGLSGLMVSRRLTHSAR